MVKYNGQTIQVLYTSEHLSFMSETFMSPSILSQITTWHFYNPRALKGMQRQSTAHATGVIVVIPQLQ